MKKIALCILLCSVFLTACASSNNTTTGKKATDNETKTTSTEASATQSPTPEISTNSPNNSSASVSATPSSEDSATMDRNVKDYILNQQQGKSEAEKIKWSKTFLDKVDLNSLYKTYIAEGNQKDNIDGFAIYITKNAPIQNNWQELFKSDFAKNYDNKVTKFEALGNDLYQVYVNNDGKEVPFVTVSARTGYYHG